MKTYISKEKALEAIAALKAFCEKVDKDGTSKQKRSLLTLNVERIMLQIDLKKIPTNVVTYTHIINDLPSPWQLENECDICFIVRDPDAKKFLADRDLDLRLTREHYESKLLEAGFSEEFIKQRISILPMRQLITEYKTQESKSKLCRAYEIFLADHSLMNNRFKTLNMHLGSNFWIRCKKSPFPININKLTGQQLKDEIINAITSTRLDLNGRGSTISVQFGVFNQNEKELTDNLLHVLSEVHKILGDNVSILRIKRADSMAIPMFADLGWKNDTIIVNPSRLRKTEVITDDFPLFNNSNVSVYPNGDVRLSRRDPDKVNSKEKVSVEDQFIDNLEEKWTKIMNFKRKTPYRVDALAKRKRKPAKEKQDENAAE